MDWLTAIVGALTLAVLIELSKVEEGFVRWRKWRRLTRGEQILARIREAREDLARAKSKLAWLESGGVDADVKKDDGPSRGGQ